MYYRAGVEDYKGSVERVSQGGRGELGDHQLLAVAVYLNPDLESEMDREAGDAQLQGD